MHKNWNLGRRAFAVAAVVAVVGVFGLAHATLGLYQTPGTQYVGHWVWNDDESNTASVDVRVRTQAVKCSKGERAPKGPQQQCVRNLKIEVAGLAEDGTTQAGYALVQIPAGFTREVTVQFDRHLTSLTFIKILSLGGSAGCNPI